ncbi:hypothetical protein F4778DRAFT_795463 [Xylariomycetidae sp. FL2044]|nr:hypothetical protein F4778DRAFT_795463 [Xylariomycetidae sp. FL2044]
MCYWKDIHFSIHDTRSRMTLEPFAIGDQGVYVNPFMVEEHRCHIALPFIGPGTFTGNDPRYNAFRNCTAHDCCIILYIERKCHRRSGEEDNGNNARHCPSFQVFNGYRPYRSMIIDPRPPGSDSDVPLTWDEDLDPFPCLFHSSSLPENVPEIDECSLALVRDRFFRMTHEILLERRELEGRLRQRRRTYNEQPQGGDALASISGDVMRLVMSELEADIDITQRLNSLTTLAWEDASQMMSALGEPCDTLPSLDDLLSGPLSRELNLLADSWNDLALMWLGSTQPLSDDDAQDLSVPEIDEDHPEYDEDPLEYGDDDLEYDEDYLALSDATQDLSASGTDEDHLEYSEDQLDYGRDHLVYTEGSLEDSLEYGEDSLESQFIK